MKHIAQAVCLSTPFPWPVLFFLLPSPSAKKRCVLVCVSLRAERNRSCEKRFQLMWQNGKARGRRRRRQPIRPGSPVLFLPPFCPFSLCSHTDTRVCSWTVRADRSVADVVVEIPAHMHANDPRGARPPLPSMSDTRVTSVCGLTASPLSHVRARRQAREGRCARANAAEVRKLAGVTGRCSTRNSFIISSLDYKFIWQGRRTFINIITAIKSGVVNMLG